METIYFEKDGQLYEFFKVDDNVIMPEKIKILTKKDFDKKINGLEIKSKK